MGPPLGAFKSRCPLLAAAQQELASRVAVRMSLQHKPGGIGVLAQRLWQQEDAPHNNWALATMTTTGTSSILPQAPSFTWPDLHQLDPVLGLAAVMLIAVVAVSAMHRLLHLPRLA
ncbi:MAG TPA: hypothetical protein VET87_13550, partial [Rubrivivax sp.]|nr:hypothetical protein [Rubrivivax sp.]